MSEADQEGSGEEVAVEGPPTRYGCPLTTIGGQAVIYPERERYVDVVRELLDDGFEMCVDLTAVDYLLMPQRTLPDGVGAGRYEVVANLLSLTRRERVRVRVQVPAENPSVGSIFDLYPGCEAMEREAYDMFGIVFDGHPDLTRILMPEEWDGHPLRKDYNKGAIPVQFSTSMTDAATALQGASTLRGGGAAS